MDLHLFWEGFQSAGFQILPLADYWKLDDFYFFLFLVEYFTNK